MRLVDADKLFPDVMKVDGSMAISQGQLAYAHTVEAIPKADYENRLKADMEAMLKDLDLQIDEIPIVTRHGVTGTVMTAQGMRKKIKENIQQKIDSLKGGEDHEQVQT